MNKIQEAIYEIEREMEEAKAMEKRLESGCIKSWNFGKYTGLSMAIEILKKKLND